METEQGRLTAKCDQKIFQIFSAFMERIAKFEELVTIGSRLLTGFQQGLDFVRRPPIEKSSKLVEHIIKANETKRLSSYFNAGCIDVHDSVQSVSKLRTCHLGLMDHLSKGKDILDEIELFLQNAAVEVQAEANSFHDLQLKDIDQDHMASLIREESLPPSWQKPDATDYAATMAIIYGMVKQDFNMQEKIVSSLNLKTSSGELESYCLMWSLRPFIDDEIMHKAWKFIP